MTTRSSKREKMKSSEKATCADVGIHTSRNLVLLGDDMGGDHLGLTLKKASQGNARSVRMDGTGHGLTTEEVGFELECGIGNCDAVFPSHAMPGNAMPRGRRYGYYL